MTKEQILSELIEKLVSNPAFIEKLSQKVGVPESVNKSANDEDITANLFSKAIKTALSNRADFTEAEAKFVKSVLPNGAEFLVPKGFIPKVIDAVKSVGLVRKLASVIPVGQYAGYMPKVATHPAVAWEGETVQNDGSFEGVKWTLKEVRSISYVSSVIADFSPKNVVNLIAKAMAVAIARDEDATFLTNNPAQNPNRPAGIVPSVPSANVVDNSSNELNYDALVEAISILTAHEPTFAQNAVIIVSPKGLQALAKVKDANGRPIFDQVLKTGENVGCCYAGMALGKPVYVSSVMSAVDGTDANGNETTQILVGDMNQAYLFLGNTLTVGVSKDERFSDNLITIKTIERKDFKVVYPEAFALIKTKA